MNDARTVPNVGPVAEAVNAGALADAGALAVAEALARFGFGATPEACAAAADAVMSAAGNVYEMRVYMPLGAWENLDYRHRFLEGSRPARLYELYTRASEEGWYPVGEPVETVSETVQPLEPDDPTAVVAVYLAVPVRARSSG